MNKNSRDLLPLVLIFCLVFIGLQIGVRDYQPLPVAAADSQNGDSEPGCRTYVLSEVASTEMPVPSFCIDGLCKLVLYTNAIFGAFDQGYLWEVYYYQWSSTNIWVAGPNISFGGVDHSEGYGYNGNGVAEGVFLGGTTGDGGYIRIMDDGPNENDPNIWSIEARASKTFNQASIQVCSIPGVETRPNITSHTAIDMPSFCLDSMCMILRFTFATFEGFGPGLSLPVFYQQDSTTESWIGGPFISMGGVAFSSPYGNNGTDSSMTPIFDGGVAEGGGVAQLLDDGAEWSDSQWSVYFEGDDQLNMVYYFIAPMTCEKYDITGVYTNIPRPTFCLDELCTIVRWNDAWFGAWGPGFSLPVQYIQRSNTNRWTGGPALSFAGASFSSGLGLNGDTSAEVIFESGRTSPNEGYIVLRDDSISAGETYPYFWNVVMNAQDDLSTGAYYICSNTCEETVFLINNQYLPFIDK
ncbi:MAG: hypothetical protein H0S79_18650 [Anaerolineaceae bacterium]|nr:hypothetical protein [Anaerolineaceae bacterium]